MKRIKNLVCLCMVLLLVFASTNVVFAANSLPEQEVTHSIDRAVEYLHSIQNEDGGFPSRAGRPSSRGVTCWVIMALKAAGEDVTCSAWQPSGLNPVDFLNNYEKLLDETTDYARMLLTLTAAGQGLVYQDINLAEKIVPFQQSSGQFAQPAKGEEGWVNSHMWSILALSSVGYDIPNKEKAREWMLNHQNEDGGFGWIEGTASDSDDTGVALQTLVLLGEDPANSIAIKNALDYLKTCQEEDGGFNCGDDWMAADTNSASTSWGLQGLIASGEDITGEKWTINGNNPVSYLLSLQNNDGSFNWKKDVISSPVTMTAYAILALAQKPFPVNIDHYSNNNPVASGNSTFSDLSSNNWAYKPIINLVEAGVLSGYPDGTFKPDKSVSRAEFTKFMVCGLGLENMNTTNAKGFPDVPGNHWAQKYISISVDKGYVNGMPDGSFNPNGQIKGAELATMIVRALPEEEKNKMVEGPEWYSGYVSLAEENGLLYPGFQANVSATRAQCAYSIVQLRNLLAQY